MGSDIEELFGKGGFTPDSFLDINRSSRPFSVEGASELRQWECTGTISQDGKEARCPWESKEYSVAQMWRALKDFSNHRNDEKPNTRHVGDNARFVLVENQ